MEQDFTVLENKTIGRNLYKFRKIREKKAFEIADHIGISEAAYTKYERGESKITIDLVQKAAEFLQVDPIQILTTPFGHLVEHIENSPNAGVGNYIGGDLKLIDENHLNLVTKLIENVISMNEKIMALLEKQ